MGSRTKADTLRYIEVWENTQSVLLSIVEKLYSQIEAGEPWTRGEVERNEGGGLVIQDLAEKLGCLQVPEDTDPRERQTLSMESPTAPEVLYNDDSQQGSLPLPGQLPELVSETSFHGSSPTSTWVKFYRPGRQSV